MRESQFARSVEYWLLRQQIDTSWHSTELCLCSRRCFFEGIKGAALSTNLLAYMWNSNRAQGTSTFWIDVCVLKIVD